MGLKIGILISILIVSTSLGAKIPRERRESDQDSSQQLDMSKFLNRSVAKFYFKTSDGRIPISKSQLEQLQPQIHQLIQKVTKVFSKSNPNPIEKQKVSDVETAASDDAQKKCQNPPCPVEAIVIKTSIVKPTKISSQSTELSTERTTVRFECQKGLKCKLTSTVANAEKDPISMEPVRSTGNILEINCPDPNNCELNKEEVTTKMVEPVTVIPVPLVTVEAAAVVDDDDDESSSKIFCQGSNNCEPIAAASSTPPPNDEFDVDYYDETNEFESDSKDCRTTDCGDDVEYEELENIEPETEEEEVVVSDVDARSGVPITSQYDQIVIGINAFSNDLFSSLAKSKRNSNFVASPYSITSVLAMTFAGAEEKTAEEIKSIFNFPADKHEALKSFSLMESSLLEENQNFSLSSANNVYVNKGFHLKSNFTTSIRQFFNVTPEQVNFAKEVSTRKTINDWVTSKTKGKITDLIKPRSVDSDTRVLLINAAHFKGSWVTVFDPFATRKKPFHIDSQKTIECDTMHSGGKFLYAVLPDLDAKALKMKYVGGRMSMTIIRPNKITGLSKLENSIGKFDWRSVKFTAEDLDLAIPKFKIQSSHNLVQILRLLGLKDLFDSENANLSGMSDEEGLFVSRIVQKATIEVNEQGTEASAASSVFIDTRSFTFRLDFSCDRPFMFIISDDKTGMPIFVGRVTNPTKN